MNSRLQLLGQIRQESLRAGVAAALQTARAAVEDGRLALTDVPEVFLALRRGNWQLLLPAQFETIESHAGGSQAAA